MLKGVHTKQSRSLSLRHRAEGVTVAWPALVTCSGGDIFSRSALCLQPSLPASTCFISALMKPLDAENRVNLEWSLFAARESQPGFECLEALTSRKRQTFNLSPAWWQMEKGDTVQDSVWTLITGPLCGCEVLIPKLTPWGPTLVFLFGKFVSWKSLECPFLALDLTVLGQQEAELFETGSIQSEAEG